MQALWLKPQTSGYRDNKVTNAYFQETLLAVGVVTDPAMRDRVSSSIAAARMPAL